MEPVSGAANGTIPVTSVGSLAPTLPTFHRHEVPAAYREPFISSGYRKANATISECLSYAFVRHNDVCNFWSHFLALLLWLSGLYLLSLSLDLSQPFYYPLLCFWLGACAYALFSSTAHLFGCRSVLVRSFCFMLDYLGISIYVAGGGLYSFHFQLPLSSSLYQHMYSLVCLHLLLSAASTLVSSLSRYFWVRQRFMVRALAYTPAYFMCIAPFSLRLLTCISTGQDCIWSTLHLHFISIVLTWVLLFFFVTKIPERFAPGKFDIFFQSHTLFHISAASLTTVQMYMFPIDCEARRTELVDKIAPSFQGVLLPFMVMIAVGLSQILILTWLVVRGVLIPNRSDVPPSVTGPQNNTSVADKKLD